MATVGNIKIIKIGTEEYDILPKYIQDSDGNSKTWSDITALAAAAKLDLIVVDELPTASASTMGNIYLVAESGTVSGTYVEYVTLKSGTTTVTYSWERIGTTQADLSEKADKGTYTSSSAGAHTHTVSGSVTVPKVSKTSKKLGASMTGVTVAANGTASVLTSLGTPSTDSSFLTDESSVSVSGGVATNTNIKATASGTAVGANGTAAAITGFGDHTTENVITGFGTHSTNSFVTGYAAPTKDDVLGSESTFTASGTATTTNIKATASGTAVGANGTASVVKSYPGVTSKLDTVSVGSASNWSAGSLPTLGTAITADDITSWSAGSVTTASVTNGVLTITPGSAPSLAYTAKSIPNVTGVGSLPSLTVTSTTVADGTLSSNGTGDAVMTGLGTASTATVLTGVKVTSQPTINLATGATAGTGVINVATGIDTITVTPDANNNVSVLTGLGSASTAAAITALGTPTTAAAITALGTPKTSTVLTGVKVTSQPTINLATGATAGTGVVSVTTTVSAVSGSLTKKTASAITALGTPGTATALTGVKVATQPTITLNGEATDGIDYVSDVTIGTSTASLTSGTAASNGAHTHNTTL